MSRPIQSTLACPRCGKESQFTVWTTLNVSLNPEVKERLMAGELFRFTCPACGEAGQVLYPMLYHDMERKLMIWLVPPDQTEQTPQPADAGLQSSEAAAGYTFRTVRSVNELAGKIHTFDAGLDDVVIEMVKLAIFAQMPETRAPGEVEVHFVQIDQHPEHGEILTFAVVTPTGTSAAALPREPAYSDMQKAVAELSQGKPAPGPWPRVDAQYLRELMSLTGGEQAPASPASTAQDKPWWDRN